MFHHIQKVIESIISSPQSSLIEEITLADSHSAGDNLDYSITALDERINLISGCPRPRYMMPDLTTVYDQVPVLYAEIWTTLILIVVFIISGLMEIG